MNRFFYKTGVKAVCAVLCVLSFAVAAAAGIGVISLVATDAYGTGDYYGSMARAVMRDDMARVLYDYFDPNDPTHPWESYYSGGIYTGEDSNFIYRIVDDETGKVVLSTYTGAPKVRVSNSLTGAFETSLVQDAEPAEQTSEDTLTHSVFQCAGNIFAYDWEGDVFRPVESEEADYFTDAVELPAETLYDELVFRGTVYRYDGEYFVRAYSSQEESVSYVVHQYTIDAYLLSGLPYDDTYRDLFDLANIVLTMRDGMVWLLIGGLVLGTVLLVVLCCAVDHRNGTDELALHPIFRIPTDVALAAAFGLGLLCLVNGTRLYPSRFPLWPVVAVDAVLGTIVAALCVYTVVMLFARGKKGILLTGTLIFWILKNAGRFLHRAAGWIEKGLRYLPLLWKVIACYLAICLFELFLLAWGDADFGVGVLWFLEHLVLGALVCYVTLAFRRLKTGAEVIAAGDYTSQVSKQNLVLDFADTADTLNHIRDGMNTAVESRMRSERMKTDLIANMSHDLKTPLTSIVSYVDLLEKELGDSEVVTDEARGYLTVLDRQSARMKKLIEDLVEASKASSGTLNLQMEPLDFNMLLGQALGEYTQRIADAGLTTVTRLPEDPITVMADGQRLWRVFDNLLGNAVKYGMAGTRLYLQVDAGDREVTATFRNISREPLTADAGELMERFVRGDASRHTEGSGLGLSIARSLTESMGGRFGLEVDGDLFKATVTFPVLMAE